MRFLHTADWHLGRWFHGSSLLEDQAHVLDQFVELAARERVDAVVIAGDVYDRAVPPADAVSLLGDVLERLVVRHAIPVVLIAGNHDSAERIGFGGPIFERQGLHLRGTLSRLEAVTLQGRQGPVDFHPLPYVEPAFARALEGGESVTDHAQAMSHVLARIRSGFQPDRRHVLVAHAFVAGGSESESERPLSVGGSGGVPPSVFEGFDYVALGHLHRPQRAGSDRIRYAGSLLKYSFDEAAHDKSVSLVEFEFEADGNCRVTPHRLRPRRDVRVIEGRMADLLAGAEAFGPRTDYLSARITDDGPVLDAMARLREVYPQLMEIRFARQAATGPTVDGAGAGDHRRRTPADLFASFFRDMQGQDWTEAQRAAFEASTRELLEAPPNGVLF
ncbi:exonuclease SbcCD subunit D [Ramlibacter sp. AW1]|uniref:Nuclease SbcCD subunit D n=1 Tax=Ramlibacter aurantiacus TaxID=2801330 RepID=A0A936ZSR3_9BURK|nr:exonuclease SbcCD subunit D [Ramlibacter aurantiacus]MBL0419939.1 exonuclease SbcCD subunit D [Ramlibacter aurantiacus]